MEAKTFEIRDEGTFIPALAVRLFPACEADRYLLRRAGYGVEVQADGGSIVLWRLNGGEATYDPHRWRNSRTMTNAHQYIIKHWDGLKSGSVIDVQFILGETAEPKQSECKGD